ncbi:hypothetical protein K3495_g8333 [Podosphaera aphanis]|nr:hypothetical protein K3495_g8333 [Podosphaera aphanis]
MEPCTLYLSAREQADILLAHELRAKRVITTPGAPFEASIRAEIDGLIARGVFVFVKFSPDLHKGYADEGKDKILTQSPTIQRVSQRLILSIAPTLLRQGYTLWLRDITQAYTQSATPLQRTVLAYLPTELRPYHPDGTIIQVIKPLYGIAEAGTHWWATYITHHKENLSMAKPKQFLDFDCPITFNGGKISLEAGTGNVAFKQKGQVAKITPINPTAADAKQQYIEQRARGAYLASICQPEACFDLSTATQKQQNPSNDDITALNKWLRWQIDNPGRGLVYVPVKMQTAKIFVFVDGSFANNVDYSSLLGFVIVYGNETTNGTTHDNFFLRGNIIHFSSTKSKRIVRSTLASEIYAMVAGLDMAYAIKSTLELILSGQDGLGNIPIVVCTDSYSLYECLVKLGTTKEKRLMIDIMGLPQSYERREIDEVRWIDGKCNMADGLTKASPNTALAAFVTGNEIAVHMEGWVTRGGKQ